ncbi:MAG TPA: hypothetical protein VFQ53_10595 [Kofleriaceae bacterium]|nr:hypothetical protein [Kofleriaceae bacterium]
MGRSLLFLVGLTGCAQLAGIDETSGTGRAGVSLSFERVSVGASVSRAPLDLTGRTATFLVPDAADPTGLARVAATQDGVDRWTAEIFDATPSVVFDLPDFPDPLTRMLAFDSRDLLGDFVVLEHPNATPAPDAASLTVQVALDTPYNGEGLQIFTLGSWNQRGLEAPVLGAGAIGPLTFAMTSMTSLTGRPHEAITSADSVVVLRYIGNQLNGALEATPFDQTGNDMITGTINPVPADRMLDIRVNQAQAVTRYSTARPAVTNISFSWALRAAPGADLNVDLGPLLNAATVGTDPQTITAMYGNPFAAKWKTILTWSTSASRSVVPTGQTLPIGLSAQMFQREVEPGAGAMLDLPAGFPQLITIGTTPLSADNTTIPVPTSAVEVSFVTDRPTNTFYQAQLFEIVPNADATALVLKPVVFASAAEPKFVFPPELFQPGKTYTIRAVSVVGGFPNAAAGDLRTRAMPFALSLLDSGVFQVMP